MDINIYIHSPMEYYRNTISKSGIQPIKIINKQSIKGKKQRQTLILSLGYTKVVPLTFPLQICTVVVK